MASGHLAAPTDNSFERGEVVQDQVCCTRWYRVGPPAVEQHTTGSQISASLARLSSQPSKLFFFLLSSNDALRRNGLGILD